MLCCDKLFVKQGLRLRIRGQCVMAAFSPLRPVAAWRVEAPFSAASLFDGFYTLWSLWLAAQSCMTQHLAPGRILYMHVVAHAIILPLLFCPIAPAKPVLISTGDSISEKYWTDLFQDVLDHSRHLFTSRTHVVGVASGSVCKIWPFQTFAVSWSSQRWPTTRHSSSFHAFPLKTEYSSSTTASTTACCRLGWMWPFPYRRLAMYYMECKRSHWICFLKQTNRELKLKYLKKVFTNNNIVCLQEVHGKDEYLQAFQVLVPRFRFFGTWRGSCDTFHYLSKPWSFCEHTIWTTQPCQRAFRTGAYLETIVWKIASHSPALACISQWGGHFFGWLQHLWSRRSTFSCVEPDIHWWRPEEDCHVPLFFHTSLRLLSLIIRKGTPQPLESYAPWRELIVFLLNLPVVEVRDFHCYSHVFENLVNRTIPSDHAAVCLVIQKPTHREQQGKRIFPDGCPQIPFSVPFLQQLHDDHRFSPDLFGALAEFKILLQKAKKQTVRELSRKTPDSVRTKLLIASTALRAYRKRHLGTLMRCCDAWKPIEDCFDPTSFECVDFFGLSQIIANLTRESLAEREAEITNLPWTQTEERHCFSQMQKWTTCLA